MLPFEPPPPSVSPPPSPVLFAHPSSPTVEPPSSSTKRKDTPSSSSKKMQKKNSPQNTEPPHMWLDAVFQLFGERLTKNSNSKDEPYFVEAPVFGDVDIADVPPALKHVRCHNPAGSNFITLCYEKQEYKRPLHRIQFLLKIKNTKGVVPMKENQASHLCMDMVNVDGIGTEHCCNPDHLVDEDDATNKLRQRCAGWIWIHPITAGGFWYPSCTHQPACLRFTPKSCVPTLLK